MNKKSIFLLIIAFLVVLIVAEVILIIASYRSSLTVENQRQGQNNLINSQGFFDILGETVLPENIEEIDGNIIEIDDDYLEIEMVKPIEIDEELEELNRLGKFPRELIEKQILAVKVVETTEIFILKETDRDISETSDKEFIRFEDLAEGDHVFIFVESYLEDKNEYIANYIQLIRKSLPMD
ncbi:MAG: hypothetical protein PHH35_02205 [Candidatus Pacebacteria bacterium]|nr:hypothetical protein [Candidatus Paceibacterota bacterium]